MKQIKTTQLVLALVVVIGLTLGSGVALASGDYKYDDKKDDKKKHDDKKKKKFKKKVPACKKSQGAAPYKNPHCKKKKY